MAGDVGPEPLPGGGGRLGEHHSEVRPGSPQGVPLLAAGEGAAQPLGVCLRFFSSLR